MITSPVGTLDSKAVELIKQDPRVAEVAARVNRLAVDGADGLQLQRPVKTSLAECVAAWLGGDWKVEGSPTYGALQALVNLGLVVEVLIIDRTQA